MNTYKPSSSFFHSFVTMPKVRFETQGSGEEIILLLRAHPITQIYWLINAFFFSLVLVVFDLFVPSGIPLTVMIFLNLLGFALIFSYIWFNFLTWFFHVGLITTERIIDIDFTGILYKEITEAKLNKVEDITSKSTGYVSSVFNYGDVFIQTAGQEANIEFLKTPAPSQIVKIINDMVP
ncbi:hypothetical protein COT62_03300 [Candidatus Roizmanbacteria bacterium CG09_land_8_20_14_0_10_41_9]|uniref:DUF304 domain-containing protein n=1 Tax=Candidatus Roizmanbacteria bacterium CG09_land_8_20_14_0_10_41_9 TaxID=1974850 RepID=A0A2H0WS87_9BACT|nr:MAG: hypothetical protein COT62_03300 [Candidatus Roizmanbacteria bacterium CG09_land_8_20_14_0_10_41_9]